MTIFKSAFKKSNQSLFRAATHAAPSAISSAGKLSSAIAPAPPPTPVTMPWDTSYENTVAALERNRAAGAARTAAGRTQTQQDYGFNADGSANTLDPYSRLAELKAGYAKIKRGHSANLASAGFGYDGSFQNQVNTDQGDELRAKDSLLKAFKNQMSGYDAADAGAAAQYTTDLAAAGNQRADAAAQAIADGSYKVYAPNPRRDAVLAALSGKLTAAHRARLIAEAQKNGWV